MKIEEQKQKPKRQHTDLMLSRVVRPWREGKPMVASRWGDAVDCCGAWLGERGPWCLRGKERSVKFQSQSISVELFLTVFVIRYL